MEHAVAAVPHSPAATRRLPPQSRCATAEAPRFNLYAYPHKGLRLCLTNALTAAGRVDSHDDSDVAALAGTVRDMLRFCRAHLDKEEHFVHPALEARRPGASVATHHDHEGHLEAFAELERDVAALEASSPTARDIAAARLYRHLARFLAENLAHMEVEETVNNEALWEDYSDDELRALEARLVASIPPDLMQLALRWMVPAMAPAERAEFLGAIRLHAPPEAFAGVLACVEPYLTDGERRKLARALALS